MKHFKLYEDFRLSEQVVEPTKEDFLALKKGDTFVYMGAKLRVTEPGEFVVKTEMVEDPTKKSSINLSMFLNKGRLVRESSLGENLSVKSSTPAYQVYGKLAVLLTKYSDIDSALKDSEMLSTKLGYTQDAVEHGIDFFFHAMDDNKPRDIGQEMKDMMI